MKNSQKSTNFWFGFTMGTVLTSILIYSFGTKEGRKLLKEIIAAIENNESDFLKTIKKMVDGVPNVSKKNTGGTINTVIKKIEELTE